MFKLFSNIYSWAKNLFNNKKLCMGANQVNVRYLINDPAYPELTNTLVNPVPYKLQMNVRYYTGKEAPFTSPEGKAMNVYGILCFATDVINKKLNLNRWAVVQSLQVDPLAGIQANAYYDREGLKFFSFNSNGKSIDTCMSSDIVAHEAGHAFLDAIKPEMFSSASLESAGFHESFGDVVSIFCALKHPQVVDVMWAQTNGDLKKDNIVESVAEQFGLALNMGQGLRKARNSFVYDKPENLPANAPNDVLSSECHSYSRVMTGAVYDVFCEAVKFFGNTKDSVAPAVDLMIDTYLDACRMTPNTSNFYTAFSKIWLTVVKSKESRFYPHMEAALNARNLLSGQVSMQSSHSGDLEKFKKTTISYGFSSCRVDKVNCIVPVSSLYKDIVMEQNLDDNSVLQEIMQLNISLAADELVVASSEGSLYYGASLEEAGFAARKFVEHLVEKNMYGQGPDQPFYKDENNNLVRKFFACDCFNNNCRTMGNPEYGKCWKPKNNSGCCPYGSCAKDEDDVVEKKVKSSCNSRYNSSCGSIRYNGNC